MVKEEQFTQRHKFLVSAFGQELLGRWLFPLVTFPVSAQASGLGRGSFRFAVNVPDHRRFPFFLGGSLGGGTSYAVTGLMVRGSSATCSQTTRMCLPLSVHPKVEGLPLESLGTVGFSGLPTPFNSFEVAGLALIYITKLAAVVDLACQFREEFQRPAGQVGDLSYLSLLSYNHIDASAYRMPFAGGSSMSTSGTPTPFPVAESMQELRKHWLLFLILGCTVSVLGTLAIVFSFIATLATIAMFGTFLLAGGILHLVNAISGRSWRGFFIHLLIAVLYVVVGMVMLNHPLSAAAGVTLMMAAIFMASGILRIVISLLERFHTWPLVLINGFVSLFLGIFIWRHFPESSLWVIGLFVGIDLLFSGWSWVMLALTVRSLRESPG
jgi:uncharacterized membrane protein HdeD (DUF308 family)